MPAVGLAAEVAQAGGIERQAREHGDAVIALLAVERDMRIAEPRESLERKLVVRTFGFLQAEHVRPLGLDETRHQVDAKPHGVDVPGRDRDVHGFQVTGSDSSCPGLSRAYTS